MDATAFLIVPIIDSHDVIRIRYNHEPFVSLEMLCEELDKVKAKTEKSPLCVFIDGCITR